VTPSEALQKLYNHAIQSRLLPPAALPELQNLAKIVLEALEPKKESPSEPDAIRG
jgi:hypothetical protein